MNDFTISCNNATEQYFNEFFQGKGILEEISEANIESMKMDISSTIALSGTRNYLISIGFESGMAYEVAGIFLGSPSTPVEPILMKDVIAEVSNILCGRIKTEMDAPDLKISLPRVIEGTDHSIFSGRSGIKTRVFTYNVNGKLVMQFLQSEDG